MFTKTRVASVVHDSDGGSGEGFLTHPRLAGVTMIAARIASAAQSQAVKRNCVATGSDFPHAALRCVSGLIAGPCCNALGIRTAACEFVGQVRETLSNTVAYCQSSFVAHRTLTPLAKATAQAPGVSGWQAAPARQGGDAAYRAEDKSPAWSKASAPG